MKKIALYFHIPFCEKKCFYCGFQTYFLKNIPEDQFLNKIIEEIKYYNIDQYEIETIYFGGGTPNILSEKFYKKILQILNLSAVKEITIELNPEFVTYKQIDSYKKYGINRFSLGVQTFNNEDLKKLNRGGDLDDIKRSLNILNGENYSIDILYGYPYQQYKSFKDDLNFINIYNPPHLSIYNLSYDEGSFFKLWKERKKLIPLNEDLELKMYKDIVLFTEKKGLKQYEISNFSKKGGESIHNLSYWSDKSYIGIGPSSHSYYNFGDKKVRSIKEPILKKYLTKKIDQIEKKEVLTYKEYVFDLFYSNFRKLYINIDQFKKKTDIDLKNFYQNLDGDIWKNWLKIEGNYIKITKEGVINSNFIFETFYNKIF